MPRVIESQATRMINYFRTASIDAAEVVLDMGKTILRERQGTRGRLGGNPNTAAGRATESGLRSGQGTQSGQGAGTAGGGGGQGKRSHHKKAAGSKGKSNVNTERSRGGGGGNLGRSHKAGAGGIAGRRNRVRGGTWEDEPAEDRALRMGRD